jgi:predicted permease
MLGIVQALRAIFRRSRVEDELDEELRDHVHRELARQIANGVDPKDAVRQASIRAGNLEAAKEGVRDERGGRWLTDAATDVRVGLRGLRRSPGLTAAVVLSLGLGVAGTTAISSVVHAVLLRSMAYRDASQLYFVRVWWNSFSASLSPADFEALREQGPSLVPVAAFFFPDDGFTMMAASGPEVVRGAFITDELTTVLGVAPIVGPGFSADRNAPEALIGYDLWQSQFGGRPDVIGRSLTLDGRSQTIVGVMPASFDVPGEHENQVWARGFWRAPRARAPFYVLVVVRLPKDLAPDVAASKLTEVIGPILRDRFGTKLDWRYGLRSIQDAVVGDSRRTLMLALGAVGLVLLIAILNVANLLLARGTARAREFAVRASLGASRGRLARQLLAESAMLGIFGGVLGLGLADLALSLTRGTALTIIPRMHEVQFNVPVALFAVGTGIVSGLLAGTIPVWRVSWGGLADSLRDGGRTTGEGRRQGTARRVLVALEIAVTLTVLAGAALLAKTLMRLEQTDPGFVPTGVVSFRLTLPDGSYPPDRTGPFVIDLESRLRAIPQVTSVGYSGALPPNRLYYTNDYLVEGKVSDTRNAGVAVYVEASPAYFQTLGIRLIQGRAFDSSDRQNGQRVAIVNEAFVRKHFPTGDVIGKRLTRGGANRPPQWTTIVGVAADVPYESGVWGGAAETVYEPFAQNLWQSAPYFVVKSNGDPATLIASIRETVRAVDPMLPLRDAATMDERLQHSTLAPRFRSWLALALAAVALALALTGIYGVMAYHVTQRHRETAIRRALGARGDQIVAQVLASGARLAGVGIVAGLAGALAVTRSLRSVLYQVEARDPAVLVAVASVLTGAALLACLVPAVRAARVDPMTILRDE